jgi:hypothetical protein
MTVVGKPSKSLFTAQPSELYSEPVKSEDRQHIVPIGGGGLPFFNDIRMGPEMVRMHPMKEEYMLGKRLRPLKPFSRNKFHVPYHFKTGIVGKQYFYLIDT